MRKFKYGQQGKIGKLAGISKSHMSDIMNRRKQANADLAERLETASSEVLGKENMIPWTEFARSKKTDNKYFK